MNKVIQFPTGAQRKKMQRMPSPQPKLSKEQRYMNFLQQVSHSLFEAADRFGVDVKDLLSDLNYVVIGTDIQMGEEG